MTLTGIFNHSLVQKYVEKQFKVATRLWLWTMVDNATPGGRGRGLWGPPQSLQHRAAPPNTENSLPGGRVRNPGRTVLDAGYLWDSQKREQVIPWGPEGGMQPGGGR